MPVLSSNSQVVDRLRQLFSIDDRQPFGPVNSEDLDVNDKTDQECLRLLFDSESRIFRAVAGAPPLIIGRRGSGKTAFIQHFAFDEEVHYSLYLRQHHPLAQVIELISEIDRKGAVLYPEMVAEFWQFVVRNTIILRLASDMDTSTLADDSNARLIFEYGRKIDKTLGQKDRQIDDDYNSIFDRVSAFLKSLSSHISEATGKTVESLAELIRSVSFPDATYVSAWRATENFLLDRKRRIVVLFDSIEDYRLDVQKSNLAIQGLMKFVSSLPVSKRSGVRVIFCLPVEQYHQFFEDGSSNPVKDFKRRVLLQWNGVELLRIAAQRFMIFLRAHHQNTRSFTHFENIALQSKTDVLRFFDSFLPQTVLNRNGGTERSVPYVLRHVQTLPRHLLMYLNEMTSRSAAQLPDGAGTTITSDVLKSSIRAIEPTVCQEIFVGYKVRYPDARQVCETVVPSLPSVFSRGDLEKLYTRSIRRAQKSGTISWDYDLDRILRLLVEIGAVGRVEETTDEYIRARFEYVTPHKLHLGVDDQLCIHPLFTGTFAPANDSPTSSTWKPIYPLGADPDDSEFRDFS